MDYTSASYVYQHLKNVQANCSVMINNGSGAHLSFVERNLYKMPWMYWVRSKTASVTSKAQEFISVQNNELPTINEVELFHSSLWCTINLEKMKDSCMQCAAGKGEGMVTKGWLSLVELKLQK